MGSRTEAPGAVSDRKVDLGAGTSCLLMAAAWAPGSFGTWLVWGASRAVLSAGSEAGGGGAVQVEAPAHGPGLCWAPVAARPPHPGMLGKRLLPPSEGHGRGRPGPQVAEQTCTDCPGSGPATTGTMAQGSLTRCRSRTCVFHTQPNGT